MEQSASLPGSVLPSSRPLRRVRSRALRAALACPRRVDGLLDDLAPLARVLLEELRQLLVDRGGDKCGDLGVAQLGLGLALELRVLEFDRDERREALAHVLAGEVVLLLLEEVLLPGIVVERARERRPEAGEVRSALSGVDVVGEGEDGLVVRRVPLHGDLYRAVWSLVLEVDDAAVDRILLAVDVGDEIADAALILEGDALAVGALVVERDGETLGEERRLAQALGEHAIVVVDIFEDVGVCQEGDGGARRAVLLEFLPLDQVGDRVAALEALVPVVAVHVDVELEPLAERVDHGDADAMQTAGDLVAGAAELAAGVQHGEDDGGGGQVVLLHDPDGDAAAVVGHGDGVVGIDGDGDGGAIAGEGLVHRVVHDLVDEVMETSRPRGADVHAGPLADRLKAFEDLDILGVVARLLHTTSQWPRGWAMAAGGRQDLPAQVYQNLSLRATLGPGKIAANRRFWST